MKNPYPEENILEPDKELIGFDDTHEKYLEFVCSDYAPTLTYCDWQKHIYSILGLVHDRK